MVVACQCSPQESLARSEKFFLHLVPMNSQQSWKAKLEKALFCRVQSGKITVCYVLFFQAEIQKLQKDILELKNSQPPSCPKNDPNYHLLNDHCIFLEHTKLSYQDAKQNCKVKFGGHGKLYEPLTWSENQMAYDIAFATGTVNWWIGVNDKQTEGSFVYESNGTPIPYTPKVRPDF